MSMNIWKWLYNVTKWDSSQEWGWFNIQNRTEDRIKPPDHLDKCQKSIGHNLTPFPNENTQQTGTKKNFLKLIKDIYEKPVTSITLNEERWNAFYLTLEIRPRCLFSLLLFNTVLERLARAHRQEKKNSIQISFKGRSTTVSICRWQDCIYRKSKEYTK